MSQDEQKQLILSNWKSNFIFLRNWSQDNEATGTSIPSFAREDLRSNLYQGELYTR